MILAFGKHAPPESSHHAKKFGLLSLVVSVVVALGLAALGPDTDGASWFGLIGQQGSGATSFDSNGTTQRHRSLLASSEDHAPQLGAIAVESVSPDPFHGLRRLGHESHIAHPGVCGQEPCCTCQKSKDGLGFLEIAYYGSPDYLDDIKQSLTIIDNRGNQPVLYSPNGVEVDWSNWGTTTPGDPYFIFNFPPIDKNKVTQTEFHFCIGKNLGPCETHSDFLGNTSPSGTSSSSGNTESVCDYSDLLSGSTDQTCYSWDVHTSCSTQLIGEDFMFATPFFEIIRWGDAHAFNPMICESDCGNEIRDAGEECDGEFGCTADCTCNTAMDFYPDPDASENGPYCKGADTCIAPDIRCLINNVPTCQCSCEAACTLTEECCFGQCVGTGDCKPTCPVAMQGDNNVPVERIFEATDTNGAQVFWDDPTGPNDAALSYECRNEQNVIVQSGAWFAVREAIHVVSCVAIDQDENMSDACTFDFFVRDRTPPTIDCAVDMNGVEFDPELPPPIFEASGVSEPYGEVGTTVTWTEVTVTDIADDDVQVVCVLDGEGGAGEDDPPAVSGSFFEARDAAYVVKCTATDSRGNSDTCSFSFYVEDTKEPMIDCAVDMNGVEFDPELPPPIFEASGVSEPNGEVGTTVTWTEVTVTDIADDDVQVVCVLDGEGGAGEDDPPAVSGSFFEARDAAYVVKCTATDSRGNSDTCSFSFYVEDTKEPMIDCAVDMNGVEFDPELPPPIFEASGVSEPNGEVGTTVTWTEVTVTDVADDDVQVVCVLDGEGGAGEDDPPAVSGSFFEARDAAYVVKCTATDSRGNSDTCSFSFYVEDTKEPMIDCAVDMNGVEFDPELPPPIFEASGVSEPNGEVGTTVTWTEVTVTDVADDDVQVVCVLDGEGGAGEDDPPAVSSSFFEARDAAYVVKCTATDSRGNSDTCSFSFYVEDTKEPMIDCAVDMNGVEFDPELPPPIFEASGVSEPNGEVGTTVTWTEVTVTDVADDDVQVVCVLDGEGGAGEDDPPAVSGSFFEARDAAYVVKCTATDSRGNSDTCSFSFYVEDTKEPMIDCAVDMNGVEFDPELPPPIFEASGVSEPYGEVGTTVTWTEVTVTDIADDDVQVVCVLDGEGGAGEDDPPAVSGSFFEARDAAYVVKCTATDSRGNSDTCSFSFYVDPLCGNGEVNRLDFPLYPWDEECDGSPDCSSTCKCCVPNPAFICPDDFLIPMDLDCTEGINVPSIGSYFESSSVVSVCPGGGTERSLDPTFSCDFSHDPVNDAITITRTAKFKTDCVSSESVKTCEQQVNIYCPSDSRRRLLQNILSEDEVNNWKPNPTSLRSAALFSKTPKVNG